MEEDIQHKLEELDSRLDDLEAIHRRQRWYRLLMLGGILIYFAAAFFVYSRLLSTISI